LETASNYAPPKYTAQFSLWQLFALTAVVAVVSTVLAPWIRGLELEELGYAGFALAVGVATYLWANYLSAYAYTRALAEIGKPLGQIPFYPFVPRWITVGLLAMLALIGLGIVAAAINIGSLMPGQRIFNLAEGSVITGTCLAAIHRRVALKSLLIYGERGVSNGKQACLWPAVTVRQGRTRNTIALRTTPLSETLSTKADVTPLMETKNRAVGANKK
jgi:hypothetical protein